MKIGVNAVLTTDIISPLVGEDGWPFLTAEKGDKVFIVCTSPLLVKKTVGGVVFQVRDEDIRPIPGRPHIVD